MQSTTTRIHPVADIRRGSARDVGVTEDRRIRRTQERLHRALVSLIVETGYGNITVQQLIDCADVGRSTFYSHYASKDELLVSLLTHLVSDIEDNIGERADTALSSLGVFRHVADHHELFRSLIGDGGIDIVETAAVEMLTDWARSSLERTVSRRSDVPADVHAAFLARSLVSLVAWWLDHKMPYTPEAMARYFDALTRRSAP